MATTRNRAGRTGSAVLATAFLAGLGGAVAILATGSGQQPPAPFFGLVVEPLPRRAPPPESAPCSGTNAGCRHPPATATTIPVLAEPPTLVPVAGEKKEPILPGPLTSGPRLPAPASDAAQPPVAEPSPSVPVPAAHPAALPPPTFEPVEPREPAQALEPPSATTPPLAPVLQIRPAVPGPPITGQPPAASPPPLPDPAWADPDAANWSDAPGTPAASRAAPPARLLERLTERRGEGEGPRTTTAPVAERLRGRLRGEGRLARALGAGEEPAERSSSSDGWPTPERLLGQLAALAAAGRPSAVSEWAEAAEAAVDATLDSIGPLDPAADGLLVSLGETVATGMEVADACPVPAVASETRRAALAIARRVALWRAAAACCAAAEPVAAGDVAVLLGGRSITAEVGRLLSFVEQYESSRAPADAATVKAALDGVETLSGQTTAALSRAVADHYLGPNVRIAVHRSFLGRMLPEATVTNGPVQDFVLGRPVRGRRTVEQTMDVQFLPHAGEIQVVLVVSGEVASRTVTESGPVTMHSRGQASFTVLKPIRVTSGGVVFDPALGTASSTAQLADVETSFDAVPIMGPLVRSIARNQHDENRAAAIREVNGKIVGRACREVDQQAEPRLAEMAEQVRTRLWQPLVSLGLEPTAVALEATEDVASVRLRLAAATQLAAHTPRPRAPADALVSMQVHETVANNALERFGLEGRRLELPALARLVCERLGVEPVVTDDLPDGVAVTFAARDALRVECRDGLVHVRVALEAFESGRRNWYDLVARVAYRPVVAGSQVFLERDGPVQIGGPGHEGRIELALRTIFGKIFAKERPVPLVPANVTENPRLAGLRAVQAVATDGWLAIALAEPTTDVTGGGSGQAAPASPTAAGGPPADRRLLRR